MPRGFCAACAVGAIVVFIRNILELTTCFGWFTPSRPLSKTVTVVVNKDVASLHAASFNHPSSARSGLSQTSFFNFQLPVAGGRRGGQRFDFNFRHRSAPRQDDKIGTRLRRLVGEGDLGRRPERQAIAGSEHIALAALGNHQLTGQHPHRLPDMRV